MEIHGNQAWQIASNDRFTAASLYVPGDAQWDPPVAAAAVRSPIYSRVAQSDLPTPAPGSLRISPRSPDGGGKVGGGSEEGFYEVSHRET